MFVSHSWHFQGIQTIQENEFDCAVRQMHRLLSRRTKHMSGQGRWTEHTHEENVGAAGGREGSNV